MASNMEAEKGFLRLCSDDIPATFFFSVEKAEKSMVNR